MTEPCPICHHPKRHTITDALLSGRHVAVVARQYRVEIDALTGHISHGDFEGQLLPESDPLRSAQIQEMARYHQQESATEPMETWWVADAQGQPLRAVNEEYVIDALALFKQAWQLANGDERTRQNMVQFIKDELVKDDMGIP